MVRRGDVEFQGNNNSVVYSSSSSGWAYVDGCDPGTGNRIAYTPDEGGRALTFSPEGPAAYSIWAEDGIDGGPSACLRMDKDGDAEADISVFLLGVTDFTEDLLVLDKADEHEPAQVFLKGFHSSLIEADNAIIHDSLF